MKNGQKWSVITVMSALAICTLPLRAEPVRARVLKVEGRVVYCKPGTTQFNAVKEGATLQAGGTIQSHSHALLSPIPGITVLLRHNSEMELRKLDLTKRNQGVTHRESVLALRHGSIAFAMDRRDSENTRFQVETPHGTATAHGTSGLISVMDALPGVIVSSGTIGFSMPSGGNLELRAGVILEALEATNGIDFQVIDLLTRNILLIHHDGTTSRKPATMEELKYAARNFEAATLATLDLADATAPGGGISQESMARVDQIVQRVNQSLASAGVAGIKGSGARHSANLVPGASGRSRHSNGAWSPVANPANTSGPVHSPER